MSTLDHKLKPETVQRLEVITGTGRRRRFSADDKSLIIEETLAPGAVVSEVARRHGLTPQQLFSWRRQARQPAIATETATPLFVPAIVAPAVTERDSGHRARKQSRPAARSGIIEVEIAGVMVRVGRGADARTVAAVLRALKAGA